MKLAALVVAVCAVGCQRADPAERSAARVAQPNVAVAVAPTPSPTAVAAVAEPHGCGCGMSASGCSGQCGGQCGGEAPALVAPADASWTKLRVTGMHCGGCARRIERALASIHGVLGVHADFGAAEVKVATASGTDVRHLVQPAIEQLGYHVE